VNLNEVKVSGYNQLSDYWELYIEYKGKNILKVWNDGQGGIDWFKQEDQILLDKLINLMISMPVTHFDMPKIQPKIYGSHIWHQRGHSKFEWEYMERVIFKLQNGQSLQESRYLKGESWRELVLESLIENRNTY